MRNFHLLTAVIAALFLPSTLWAEVDSPIDITFSASGEATTVETVTVTNLTHTDIAAVTLNGTDILRLVDPNAAATAIESVQQTLTITQPILTPNPSMSDGTLIFDAQEAGAVHVSICSTDGKLIESATLQVEKGRNTAFIPSQQPGIYLINIEGKGIKASTRWICGGAKSGSHISLGGAAQWANVSLPVKGIATTPAKDDDEMGENERLTASANIVRMSFYEGDILRFEGSSGQMTTIVVNAPERSHSIPFYFYPCVDASGNSYPIIEAGGMLWMAEDLKCQKGITIFYENESADWANAKQNNESTNIAMVVDDDNVYYTYAAARKAMPEGWALPTLSELDQVVRNLGGYEVVGDKMKRSGDSESFRDKRSELPDSLQLRITPKGFVSEDGTFTDTNSGFVLTATREKQKAIFMKISSGTPAATINGGTPGSAKPEDGLASYAAVHVRGVRPASSAYTDMMSKLYTASQSKFNAPRNADDAVVDEENPYTGEVNPYTGTPCGDYYTVDHSTKQIVMDVTGQKCMGWTSANDNYVPWGLDESYFGTVFVNANDGAITQKQPEGDWIRNAQGERMNRTRLKKFSQQKVEDGTYNTLKLTYNVTIHDYQSDGSTNGHWMARDLEGKEGTLTLEVFGNADTDFALQKSITWPETFVMTEYDGYSNDESRWTEDLRVNEYFMKRLNLLCADFNNDGVDDVVVGFCGEWKVYDGKDYETILAERSFPTSCVRACVGDLNENGYNDLGLIYENEGENLVQVHVLLDDIKKFDAHQNADLEYVADYSKTLEHVGASGVTPFLDIKFDDITNTGKGVLCLTVPNRHIEKNVKSAFYILHRGNGNTLQQIYKFEEEPKFQLRNGGHDWGNDLSSTNTNSTIAVVHTRGMGERPDVLLRNGLYRFDDSNQLVAVNIGGHKEDGTLIDAAILSDCVAVGRFTDDLEEGPEQLAYFGTTVEGTYSKKWNGDAGDIHSRGIRGYVELLTPVIVGSDTYMTRKELHSGHIGSVCSWTKDGDYHIGAALPAFCATSYKDIDTRRYKFVSCQATMSEPRIKFALAAAPYWAKVPAGYDNAGEDYDYGDASPSTEWATSSSSTEVTGNSNATSASVIFGYEQENKVSLFGVEFGKYGFEFETNIGYEWEKSVSEGITYAFESGCSAGRENKVGLTMTPVWLYTYECIESNDPDNIGMTVVCGAPSYPRDLELSESDYMLLRGDRDDIPDVSTIFTHTPGDPLTYLNNPNLVTSTSNIIWSNNNKDQYSTTGSDGTKSFTIEVSQENSTTTTNTFSLDMSLVAFAGAFNQTFKAGFGMGYNHKWETTYTTGFGTTVTGTVPLPKRLGDVPMFDWNMCRYSVKVGGQEFPVVNYIVKNVRKP